MPQVSTSISELNIEKVKRYQRHIGLGERGFSTALNIMITKFEFETGQSGNATLVAGVSLVSTDRTENFNQPPEECPAPLDHKAVQA